MILIDNKKGCNKKINKFTWNKKKMITKIDKVLHHKCSLIIAPIYLLNTSSHINKNQMYFDLWLSNIKVQNYDKIFKNSLLNI